MRYAIVGCGSIGAKRMAAIGAANLRVACDTVRSRAEALAAQGGGDAIVCTDWRDAVTAPGVDAVIVATLNAALGEVTRGAIEAGKPVLVEKPAGLSVRDVERTLELARHRKVPVRVGFNHRLHPALQKARALVDEGVAGPLMFLRGRYGHGGRVGYDKEWRADPRLSGGGELMDQGVHMIDLARWFLGDFAEVSGRAETLFWSMPVDDNAFMHLRTAAGQTAWLHVSCTEWKNLFSLEIYGRDAKIAVDGLGGSYGIERATLFKMLPEMGPPETTVWEYPRGDRSWRLEIEAFERDVSAGAVPVPGLAEALAAMRVVEAIYKISGYEQAAMS